MGAFHILIRRPFLTLKNNKQFLNQNQVKIITNSINRTSTHSWFQLHLHTIFYPNRQLFKVNNRNSRIRCGRQSEPIVGTRVISLTSIWCLYYQPQLSHLTLPRHPYHQLKSSNWLLDKNLFRVNGRISILKSLLNGSIHKMVNEHINSSKKLWRSSGSNVNCTETHLRRF